MKFDWDEKKNRYNFFTHGIDFATASAVFEDPDLHIEPSSVSDYEERWQAIGTLAGRFVILVAHVYRYDDGEAVIRLISARPASRKERKRYEKTQL